MKKPIKMTRHQVGIFKRIWGIDDLPIRLVDNLMDVNVSVANAQVFRLRGDPINRGVRCRRYGKMDTFTMEASRLELAGLDYPGAPFWYVRIDIGSSVVTLIHAKSAENAETMNFSKAFLRLLKR